MKHLLSISLFIRATFAMANAASKCLYNPIELVAGLDLVTMRTAYPLSEPCTATIDFEDQDFLPITYTFKPIPCDGPELAQFSVPLNAPSGEAYITWRCASELLMCSRALITGGQSDRSLNLQVDRPNGQVICEGGSPEETQTSATHSTTSTTGSIYSTLTTVTKRLTKPRSAPTDTLGGTETSDASATESTDTATADTTTAVDTTATVDATATADESITMDNTMSTKLPATATRETSATADTTTPTSNAVATETADTSTTLRVEKEKSEEPAVTSGARTTLDRSIFLPAVISTVTVLHTITARGSSCSDV